MNNIDPSQLEQPFETELAEIIFKGKLIDVEKIEQIKLILSANCAAVSKKGWFENFNNQLSNRNETMGENYKTIFQNFISEHTARCTISGGRKSTKGTKRKTKTKGCKTKTKGGKTKTRKNKKTKRRTGK
jgi:hypothetical protein